MYRFTCAGLCTLAFAANFTMSQEQQPKPKNDGYLEFYYGQSTGGEEWIQSIRMQTPAPGSDVKGDTRVEFTAPGMKVAKAMCWRQPTDEQPSHWGHDSIVAEQFELSADGRGSFVFKADDFPHGPVTLRILTQAADGLKDIYELQLYNAGGVRWNLGIPATDPPAAKGMKLVFSDDFDGPLSISNDGRNARYNAHKPGGGDFSGWQFSNPDHPNRPLRQRDTFLQIAARKTPNDKGSSGLIATVAEDRSGFWAKPPFYAECRFVAHSAPGTWPAFWTVTQMVKAPGDELDIVEAYGGVGKKNPNFVGYSCVTHFWNQFNPDGTPRKAKSARVKTMEIGGKNHFSTTFHTYAVRVDREHTIYYYDDIEVLRHATNDKSLEPHILLINYAIGGISGWQIDLERYNNSTDMYVDYIRVYQGDVE